VRSIDGCATTRISPKMSGSRRRFQPAPFDAEIGGLVEERHEEGQVGEPAELARA
jgi:hypothetical protein